jgi:CheY-like chemotaxis protein
VNDFAVMLNAINLEQLTFLVADSNAYINKLIDGMLRAFGASKIICTQNCEEATTALGEEKVDILVCDADLSTTASEPMRGGGLTLTRSIRRNPECVNRTIPILLMTRDSRESMVKRGRDAGANMVIAKPLSPKSLYDRLSWIAFTTRNFVDAPNYFGPDRRFKIEGYPNGIGRRKEDKDLGVSEQVGEALSQSDIDNLFTPVRKG